MKKKILSLLLACACVVLSACSEENEHQDDVTSNGQWSSAAVNSTDEADLSEEPDVLIVELEKPFEQEVSNEESKRVIDLISQLSDDDYAEAYVYDPNNPEPLPNDKVILLYQSETSNTKIYGYMMEEYYARGIILSINGEYAYFDLDWSDGLGRLNAYEQDFDHDGVTEIGFCFLGSHGTGIHIERLIMFDDTEGNGTLSAYEFTPKMQFEQFEEMLQFAVDMDKKELIVTKDGMTETTIDWKEYADEAEGDPYSVDCEDQIFFEIDGDAIKMRVAVGLFINPWPMPMFFEAEEGGELCFDVTYSNGVYELK